MNVLFENINRGSVELHDYFRFTILEGEDYFEFLKTLHSKSCYLKDAPLDKLVLVKDPCSKKIYRISVVMK